ncbi:hypothetical protein ACLESO_26745 [Pyxidicoccus sp. 3LG]
MIPYVTTSSEPAVLLLRELLGPELAGRIRWIDGEGWHGAVGMADSRISNEAAVALVLGPSKKSGTNAREQDKATIYRGLHAVHAGSRFRVFLLRTAPEGLLFRSPELLRQLVGREPSPEQLARARKQPGKVLAELLDVKPESLAGALRPRLETVDLTPLRSIQSIRRLRSFMRTCVRRYEATLARRLEHSSKTV